MDSPRSKAIMLNGKIITRELPASIKLRQFLVSLVEFTDENKTPVMLIELLYLQCYSVHEITPIEINKKLFKKAAIQDTN